MCISQNYPKQRLFFLIGIASVFSYIPIKAQNTFKPSITLNKLQNFVDTLQEDGCIPICCIAQLIGGGGDTAHGALPRLVSSPTGDKLERPLQHSMYPYNKKRVRLVTIANVVGYGGALIGLNAVWYAKYPRSGFHFFNDDAEWLQIDKAGHAYSAYSESRASMELWRWAGLPRKERIWIGGLSGVAYQSIIEILDGFSSQYGFSPGDFTANIIGSGIFIAQEFAWDDQRIKLKFSFHKKYYGEADLDKRADDLYGKTEIERFIKDYNAQTYWLSANIQSFFPESNFPRWLSFAAGYGAEGMFGARSNIAVDQNGNVTFNRSDIKRYRQWYFSPDVDFTKIRTNKKGLKVLFFVLSAVKFPAPTLEFSNGNIKGHWIVF